MEDQSQNEHTGLHVTEVPKAANFIRQWLVGAECEGEGWGVFNEEDGKVLEMDGGDSYKMLPRNIMPLICTHKNFMVVNFMCHIFYHSNEKRSG